MKNQKIFDTLVKYSCRIFGSNLVGVYLHGSIAMGCFNPKKSDLDVIIVVENETTDLERKILMDVIVSLNAVAPIKGIEMSLVRSEYCRNFIYPTPFDLHFSMTHLDWYKSNPKEYIEKMHGTDPDLAAHFLVTKSRGIVLYGKEISEVFGEIPADTYLDSIKRDIAEAKVEVIDNPIYIILNLCRVLAYVQDGLALSKKEGGEWGFNNIDCRYQELIKEALKCYCSDQDMILNQSLAIEYCEYMRNEIDKGSKN